jgi:hypothetical protein
MRARHLAYRLANSTWSREMKPGTYAIAAACTMLLAACGGNDNSQASAGPDVPAPMPAPATPVLLGSETVYRISAGDAFEFFTLRQGQATSDGYTAFSETYADENGMRPPFVDYMLTRNGWVLGEGAGELRLDDNGATLNVRNSADGRVDWARYREVDVSGKPVKNYLSDYFTYRPKDLALLDKAIFPAGSRLAYTSDSKPKNDQYDVASPVSPYQLSSTVVPTSIADLLERATTADPVCVGQQRHSALTFTGSASQGFGTVTAYEADDKTSVPCAITGPGRATGSWQLRSVNGANILVLTIPGLDDGDLEPAFGGYNIIDADALTTFNEIDGKVVQGYFLPAVTTLPPDSEMRAGYLLNPTAWDYIKTRLPIK